MTARLIPVQYHKRKYPEDIVPSCQEIAAHFDSKIIEPRMNYSLHTEYSYGKRKFDSALIKEFENLISSSRKGIPQLWFNRQWADEFFDFLKRLVGQNKSPEIIEVHPPFSDYQKTVDGFLCVYETFEKKIIEEWPNTNIFIENRAGSTYSGGGFLISKQ